MCVCVLEKNFIVIIIIIIIIIVMHKSNQVSMSNVELNKIKKNILGPHHTKYAYMHMQRKTNTHTHNDWIV